MSNYPNILIVCARDGNHPGIVHDWWEFTMGEESYPIGYTPDKSEPSDIQKLCDEYNVNVEFQEWDEEWERQYFIDMPVKYSDWLDRNIIIVEEFCDEYINYLKQHDFNLFLLDVENNDDGTFFNKIEETIINWLKNLPMENLPIDIDFVGCYSTALKDEA